MIVECCIFIHFLTALLFASASLKLDVFFSAIWFLFVHQSFHTIQDVAHAKSETTALGSLSAMERWVAPWFFSKGTYGKVGKGVIKLPIFFFWGGEDFPFLIGNGNVLFRLVSYNNSWWEFCAFSKAQLGESGQFFFGQW